MKHVIEAAMFSIALCIAGVSQATLLVSEPFPVGDGGYATIQKSLNGQAITDASVIGFEWQKWNNAGGTGNAFSFGNGSGLSFPGSFAGHGFASSGASAGLHVSGEGEPRIAEKKVNAFGATPNKVYLRFLMSIDSACANVINVITAEKPRFSSKTAYAAGICSDWDSDGNHYDFFFDNPCRLLFGYARNADGNVELDLCTVDAAGVKTVTTLVDAEHFTVGVTNLCVAEIAIGAGEGGKEVVRAAAFDVATYDPANVIESFSDPVELELWSDALKPEYIGFGGRYKNNNGYFMVDEFVIATELDDIVYYETDLPLVASSALTSSAAGFELSVSMHRNSATAKALAIAGNSDTPIVTTLGSATTGTPAVGVLAGLSADTSYTVYAAAENEAGAVTNKVGVIYVGTPQFAKIADADESGFVASTVTVSRVDSAFDLPVNYTCGGTAVNGVNYEALSGVAVIPAGATTASVVVKPFLARPHDASTTLSLALAAGNYIMSDPASSASVVIANHAPPIGTNTWVAAADGLASDASNWSEGRVPTLTDDILLDGDYSTANMTWDCATEGMTDTVASWTQLASYTGTVEIPTKRTGDFTCFTVTGDATLNGGKWWRAANAKADGSTAKVWLNVAFGGDLTAGEGFTFDGFAAGYPKQCGYSQGGDGTGKGGSHGGLGAGGADGAFGYGRVYGDYKNPTALGSGDYNGTSNNGAGGGAVVVEVAGDFILNGTITADGTDGSQGSGTSGGSVWIRAKTMSGSGKVTAEGGSPSQKRSGGGGGRISIQITDSESSQVGFTNAFTGKLSAAGGFATAGGSYSRQPGAAGTIYVETAADNGTGAMTLENKSWSGQSPHVAVASVWTNITWNLSSLALKMNGRVDVRKDGELNMTSFAGISGDGSDYALLLFNGGVVSSDIKHDTLVADGFGVQAVGVNSFADHTLVIPDTSTLKVSGDFTVGALKLGNVKLDAGDYSAATLRETYSNVSGDGTIHVCGLADGFIIIIR